MIVTSWVRRLELFEKSQDEIPFINNAYCYTELVLASYAHLSF
jgi:hypothetical protein